MNGEEGNDTRAVYPQHKGTQVGIDAPAAPAIEAPTARAGESEVLEALSLVYGNRQGDYGTPRQNYEAMAKVWSGMLHHVLKRDLTPEEVVICMAALKLQREAHKPKRDNVVDLHGYGIVLSRVKEDR